MKPNSAFQEIKDQGREITFPDSGLLVAGYGNPGVLPPSLGLFYNSTKRYVSY